jgi:hypothetical protein
LGSSLGRGCWYESLACLHYSQEERGPLMWKYGWLTAWDLQRKNVTLIAAVLSIYVVDFAINAGMWRLVMGWCCWLMTCSWGVLSESDC